MSADVLTIQHFDLALSDPLIHVDVAASAMAVLLMLILKPLTQEVVDVLAATRPL
jgi:hypothetical protein